MVLNSQKEELIGKRIRTIVDNCLEIDCHVNKR